MKDYSPLKLSALFGHDIFRYIKRRKGPVEATDSPLGTFVDIYKEENHHCI